MKWLGWVDTAGDLEEVYESRRNLIDACTEYRAHPSRENYDNIQEAYELYLADGGAIGLPGLFLPWDEFIGGLQETLLSDDEV